MYREMMPGTTFVDNSTCPLCDESAFSKTDQRTGNVLIVCRLCGKFCLTDQALNFLHSLETEQTKRRYKLSHAMRTISERAFGRKDNSFFPFYSFDDLQKILERRHYSVQEKLDALLTYLGGVSEFPGQSAEFDSSNDYAILGAKNYQEAVFYLESLAHQGLITLEKPYTGKSESRFSLSAKGWIELEKIAQSGAESFNAFIAMSFHPSRTSFEVAMSQAIEDAGYVSIRVDRIQHLNRIDDEIIARIRQSKFLVADFSGQRNGVYFEAGFMLGLGRPVIWVCEKADLINLHFDTRQYNMIDYVDADDLKKRLQLRIEANLGRGPHKISNEH